VSVELFFKLKEIESLTKMRNNYLKKKQEQEDRVSKLNDKRHESILQTAKLKKNLISTQNELAEIEAKIKNLSEQKQRVMDIGGDENKIAQYGKDIENFEERGLGLINVIETFETGMADTKTFLTGIEKTIQDISSEVNAENEKINNEVNNIEVRLKLLMEELPDNFRNTLNKITAKNLAHGPFTRMEQGSCYFCRFKISRIDESEIDMQKNLKTCPQCSRIFLPYGA
jgi:predicted  nucleic acid-binding Zn-ribbon protein